MSTCPITSKKGLQLLHKTSLFINSNRYHTCLSFVLKEKSITARSRGFLCSNCRQRRQRGGGVASELRKDCQKKLISSKKRGESGMCSGKQAYKNRQKSFPKNSNMQTNGYTKTVKHTARADRRPSFHLVPEPVMLMHRASSRVIDKPG